MVQYRKDRKSPWMVQIRDSRGKLISRSFVKKSDAEAFETMQTRTRQNLKAGMEAPTEEILFFDYAAKFIDQRFSQMPKSTVNQDAGRLKNYWLEPFGSRPLTSITSREIKEKLDHIQFELKHSPADRNRHRALMHRLFQCALIDDRILYNPVTKIPLVDERKKTRKTGYLETAEEQDRYIAAAYLEGNTYGVLATILLWAGPRISEAVALQYRDVDFQRGTIRINKILEKASRSIVERTKGQGEGGEYMLPLFPRVKDAILNHRKGAEYSRPTDFICCRDDGKPMSYETFVQVHRRIIAAAKLKVITIHDLRRTFASNAQRAGFSKGEIQEMLGHSSVTVTERYTIMEIDHIVEKGKRIKFGSNGVTELARKRR